MKIIIDFLKENIIFIFSILIIFIIIYLLYRTNKIEKFAVTNASNNMNDMIIKAINDQYSVDISAMRNLGSIANNILTNKDVLTIPATEIKMNTMHFSNSNPLDTTIFVRYMIIPWAGNMNNIPRGWVLCDGSIYNIENVNNYLSDKTYNSIYNQIPLIKYTMSDYNAQPDKYILLPNLIGKFIYGAGTININNDNKKMYVSKDGLNVSNAGDIITLTPGNTGGEHYHVLTKKEIPAHRHKVFTNIISGYMDNWSIKDEQLNNKIAFDEYEYKDKSFTYAARVARGQTNEYANATKNQVVADASKILENPITPIVIPPIDSDPKQIKIDADKPFNKVSRAITYTDNGECGGSLKTKATNGLSNSIYNDVPVNNLPPYYVLAYIMKL